MIYIVKAELFSSCVQTDLEEAKSQEALKFQASLDAMQKKLDEANAIAVKEREAAKKAIDEAPALVEEKEVVIEDTKKIESLTEQVDDLKVRHLNSIYVLCSGI